jgi:SnoaL-like domain
VSPSPIERVLEAFARSDVDGVAALFAPRGRLLIIDGRRAEGAAEVKDLVASVLEDLRSITYELRDQWSVDRVWIAELVVHPVDSEVDASSTLPV